MPDDGLNPEQWRSEDKFAVVLETAALNETELSEYVSGGSISFISNPLWTGMKWLAPSIIGMTFWISGKNL